MKTLFLSLTMLLFSAHTAAAEMSLDVPYGSHRKESIDISTPDASCTGDLMVFVHGGGWRVGDKKNDRHFRPSAFTQEGYVYASVNYPMLPDTPIEAQAQAVASALVWLNENIDRYGCTVERIHLMGHSAGGHLVSLVATDPRYLEEQGSGLFLIASVTALDSAALNVEDRMRRVDELTWSWARAYRKAFGSDPARWQTLSPFHQARQTSPPFLIITASAPMRDELKTGGFIDRLKRLGVWVEHFEQHYHDDENLRKTHLRINREFGRPGDTAFKATLRFHQNLR